MNQNPVLGNLITGAVTLVAAFFLFTSTVFNTSSQENTAIYISTIDRMNKLEETIMKLQSQILVMNIENIRLNRLLGNELQFEKVIAKQMDSFPIPAWIKCQENDKSIKMLMINTQFVYSFGVSKARYNGSADADIFPKYKADLWEIQDRKVIEDKGYSFSYEVISTVSEGTKINKEYQVWKYYISMPEDKQCIGGMAFPMNREHK
jgi:hypothetical protein